jgi:hypothetical protein
VCANIPSWQRRPVQARQNPLGERPTTVLGREILKISTLKLQN